MTDPQFSGWYMLLFVAIWTAFGVVGALVASRSCGWPPWAGFLIGFFGGIIGLGILWFVAWNRKRKAPSAGSLPSRRSAAANSEPRGQGRRIIACQRCGNLIEGGSKRCPYCEADLAGRNN
jgi:hypothetical protein